MSEFLPMEQLNTEQRLAVETPARHARILAGAGSGKTRVLVYRMAHLIETGQASASQILAVTFTNKAASEMRRRVESLLGEHAKGLWVGTFHGICHRILRQHKEAAKLPSEFQIIDTDDQLRLIKRVMKTLRIDEEYVAPKEALSFIAKQKEEGLRYHQLSSARDMYYQTLYAIYQAYEAELQRLGHVDFAELILRTHELLQNEPDILQRYHNQFQHILVDEFQDTNQLQYRWLRLLCQHHLFVVGDDDQSIYGWRGAQVRNLHKIQEDYPDAILIKLEQNYRSTATILNASNALIANNAERLGKALWTQADNGEPIGIYPARSDLEEARFVAERIALLHQRGTPLSGCAILYRSNAQSRLLEEALLKIKLPYRIYGGLRFFERAEIKDVLAYLRLALFPLDDAAFERVVNWPTRGIGEQSLDVLREMNKTEQAGLLAAAKAMGHGTEAAALSLSKRAQHALLSFVTTIEDIRKSAQNAPLSQTLQLILATSQLPEQYQKSRDGKGENRLENLNELIEAARQFEVTDDGEALPPLVQAEDFLTHAVLESGEHQAEITEDAVNLMTMHAAKGLEFNTVFVVGMEEGLFPHQMSLQGDQLDEERRLCYVAMTRAKQHLFLTHALSRRLYGSERHNPPSRFLREIPPACLKPIASSSSISISFPESTRRASINTSAVMLMGKRVQHARFGEGVILEQQGDGSDQRVLVAFPSGQKWLLTEKANLTFLN